VISINLLRVFHSSASLLSPRLCFPRVFISYGNLPHSRLSINETMAAIHESPETGRYAHKKAHIDMTPMVDLGFLLITFFIFTTRIEDPKALKYNEPAKGEPMPVKCTTTVTLQLQSADSVGYIECANGRELPVKYMKLGTNGGLRKALAEKQKSVRAFTGDARDLFVIIRPQPDCNYQALIDIIDEMTINEVTRYTIIE
jgi:biopolymer transport protein ExbD